MKDEKKKTGKSSDQSQNKTRYQLIFDWFNKSSVITDATDSNYFWISKKVLFWIFNRFAYRNWIFQFDKDIKKFFLWFSLFNYLLLISRYLYYYKIFEYIHCKASSSSSCQSPLMPWMADKINFRALIWTNE